MFCKVRDNGALIIIARNPLGKRPAFVTLDGVADEVACFWLSTDPTVLDFASDFFALIDLFL